MNEVSQQSFQEVVFQRRSIRKFFATDVSDESVEYLIRTALTAPSAHNAQPERFVLLKRGKKRTALVNEMSQLYKKDLLLDGLSQEEIIKRVQKSKRILLEAPLLIIACLTMEDMWNYPDQKRRRAEYLMAVQSTAAAIQNLLLAAHAKGIGACWMCAPLFCQDAVKSKLSLPENLEPQAFIVIGYPNEMPERPERKQPKDVILRL